MNWGKEIANRSITKIVKGPYDVTGVLAFKDGERMCRDTAIKLTHAFWHKANRIFFGRAADKGYGINRLAFLEYGKSGKCIHSHFVAQSPIDPVAFSAILAVLWTSFHPDAAKPKDNWITPIYDKRAVAEYVTKEVWRFRDDPHVLNCDHEGTTEYAAFANDAQVERIARHVDASALQEAIDRIPVQMVLIRKRIKDRALAQQKIQQKLMANAPGSFRQFIQSRQS